MTVVHASPAWRKWVGHTLARRRCGTGPNADRDAHFEQEWPAEIVAALHGDETGLSRVEAEDAHATVLVEEIAPPQELVLFGGGPDVVPVVEFARGLGWFITVVVAPPATQAADRFRLANRVVVAGSDHPTAGVSYSTDAAVVVMTHNLARDHAIIARLPRRPAYLGVLGPRHRTDKVLSNTDWAMHDESLHAPVGLDIGADAPEEIGLAIIAEIVAWRRGRDGGPLRERGGAIHDPSFETGQRS